MKTLQEKLRELPAARRNKIERRTALLIAEEIMTMRELRKARAITQVKMAQTLGVKQEQVSRIEKRTDMHISTLKRAIQALGGELDLIAIFPSGAVRLSGLAELKSTVMLGKSKSTRGSGHRENRLTPA